ncbi:hypothetical protein Aduo_004910 [Ancylostoma duodenale]
MVEVRTSATPSWQEGEDLPVIAIDSFRHMYLFPDTNDLKLTLKVMFAATIEHVLALKHKYELEKIEAETKARAKAARENRQKEGIFHPYDPVAHRLESLFIPEYRHITPVKLFSSNDLRARNSYEELPLEVYKSYLKKLKSQNKSKKNKGISFLHVMFFALW